MSRVYDTVIVGGGPNGLAMLSRLHESERGAERRFRGHESATSAGVQYQQRVAVIDASGGWLRRWNSHFSQSCDSTSIYIEDHVLL